MCCSVAVIQEQAGKRDSGQQHSLLSRLQENQPVHQQHFQAPATDPIIDLLTSISGNAGHANAPGHLPPIGSNMRPGFPQPAPFQPQPQHQDHHQPQPYHHQQNHHQSQNQHQQPMYSTHLVSLPVYMVQACKAYSERLNYFVTQKQIP